MEFVPTYLYIKQHSVTGKCYFGKTTRDPVKYLGSGKHWKAHTKVHGKEFVETLWFKLFTDKEQLVKTAIMFSEQQDIVESNLWLNLTIENGLDGGPIFKDKRHSVETKTKMSAARTGLVRTAETKIKMSENHVGMLGKTHSVSAKTKMSERRKGVKQSKEHVLKRTACINGIPKPKISCQFCGIEMDRLNLTRWHINKCQNKPHD